MGSGILSVHICDWDDTTAQKTSEEIKRDFIHSETGDRVQHMLGIVLLIGLQIAYLACSR